jgi:hypothetical protein
MNDYGKMEDRKIGAIRQEEEKREGERILADFIHGFTPMSFDLTVDSDCPVGVSS